MAEFAKRIVVVLNEKIETGKAVNALSHAILGFGATADKEQLKINQYVDADGNVHAHISEMPIVVLRASSQKIRELRKLALGSNVEFVDFLDTMSVGTYEEEYALTKSRKDEELEYLAIILFGQRETITEWTKKLSLYK